MSAGVASWITARLAPEPPPAAMHLSASFVGRPNNGLPFGTRHVAVSRDGARIAFAAEGNLWIRRLSDAEAIAVDEPGSAMVNPFFSPNGEWVGFLYNGLMKVPSAGGTPIQIASTTERPAGATWGGDGTIVFATTEGLYRVGEDGGEPRLMVRPNLQKGERLYAWPQFLPDERSLLFTVLPQNRADAAQIALLDLETLEVRVLFAGGAGAHYVPTGHILYAAGPTLNAIRFDLDTLEIAGEAVPLADIAIATAEDNGAADFAVSDTGTLVFVAPGPQIREAKRTLAWLDRQGVQEPLAVEADTFRFPRISPDGTLVALDMENAGNRDIWMLDLRRSSLTRLTTGPTEDLMPSWSRDGGRVFFGSDRTGNFDVYSQPADGSSDARVEAAVPGFQTPLSVMPDGTRLMVYENFHDLSVLDLERSELSPLLHRDFTHGLAEISPDGNWLAYESDESGQQLEVFVRPFPDVSARREKVSINGGRYPKWGPAGGGELLYVAPDGALMSALIEFAPTLRVGTPTKLVDLEQPTAWISPRPYDISPVDGRFLVTRDAPQTADQETDVAVILGWFAELRAQAP
jgi:serine/threonine-protein kinase